MASFTGQGPASLELVVGYLRMHIYTYMYIMYTVYALISILKSI